MRSTLRFLLVWVTKGVPGRRWAAVRALWGETDRGGRLGKEGRCRQAAPADTACEIEMPDRVESRKTCAGKHDPGHGEGYTNFAGATARPACPAACLTGPFRSPLAPWGRGVGGEGRRLRRLFPLTPSPSPPRGEGRKTERRRP